MRIEAALPPTVDYTFPAEKLVLNMADSSKIPLVLVACGSCTNSTALIIVSPITYLHLRMFEMAMDWVMDNNVFELLGGYFSPVSDEYKKEGLVKWDHRINMAKIATQDSKWLMVDDWEARQQTFVRTRRVLEHFQCRLAGKCIDKDGIVKPIKIMLLAGGDLIESFALPKLWDTDDLDKILGLFGCVVIERRGADVHDFLLQNDHLHRHRKSVFVVKQFIHNDISSSKIRLFVRRLMSIKYLLPDDVIDYILKHELYFKD